MKVQARMEDKGRIKNLKLLLAFFEKFSRDELDCIGKIFFWGSK